jgi:hypothetical protein
MVLLTRLDQQHLRGLDISNGCQDHTTSPYASAPFVRAPVDRSQLQKEQPCNYLWRADAAASTASHPAFVTIAIRPSVGETRRVKPLICPTGPVKYFCGRGLDDPNHFEISAQIEVYAHRIFGRNIWGLNP